MPKWIVSVSGDIECEADDERAAIDVAQAKIEDEMDSHLFFVAEQVVEDDDDGDDG